MTLHKGHVHAESIKRPGGNSKPGECVDSIAIEKLTQSVEQIIQLTNYSQQVFTELSAKSVAVSDRIAGVFYRIERTRPRLFDVPTIVQSQSEPGNRNEWKQASSILCNFFIPETESAELKRVYETCDPGPNLQALDQFRTDGQSCLSFYTYPAFFAEEWRRIMTKEETEKKRKKKELKSAKSSMRAPRVSEIRVKKYNSEGEFVAYEAPSEQKNVAKTGKLTRAPSVKSTKSLTRSLSLKKSEKDLSNNNGSIPNPPPLPQKLASPLSLEDDLVSKDSSPSRAGLMEAIRSKSFKLKSAPVSRSSQSIRLQSGQSPLFPNDVAAILMRRAALEMSDDEDDSDEEDWQ